MEEYRAEINARLGMSSPLKMVASDSLAADSCFVSLSVIAEGTPSGDSLKLRVAVVEDSIYYEAPNGQTVFRGVFRSFLSSPEGIDFEISQGETLDFDFAFELDPAPALTARHLSFAVSPTWRPLDYGNPDDDRELGIGVRRIRFASAGGGS